jgi:hypothetical protein
MAEALEVLRLPPEVRGDLCRLGRSVFDSVPAARTVLMCAGFEIQEELSREVKWPGPGRLLRMYGVMSNWCSNEEEDLTEGSVPVEVLRYEPQALLTLDRVRAAMRATIEQQLGHPDNDRVAKRLGSGRLKYVPCGRSLVGQLLPDLARCGLHLPWAVNGVDMKLVETASSILGGYGFGVFYSELGQIILKNAQTCWQPERIIPTPFGVDVQQPWVSPNRDDVLHEEVGLVVEAIARL